MTARTVSLLAWLTLAAVSSSAASQPAGVEKEKADVQIFTAPAVCGYVDASGRLLAPDVGPCRDLCSFQEGLAALETKQPDDQSATVRHWGFIDPAGKLVMPLRS